MNKIICDMCKSKEADNHFKVKKYKCFAKFEDKIVMPDWRWERIDVCTECYNKLISVKKEKKD